MAASHSGNVLRGERFVQSFWGSELPPHHCFKSRILRPLDFGDEGTFYPLIGRLVQIYFGISKIGFQGLWISGVIEMMTPFIFFASEMGVQFGLPSKIRYSYQGMDNLSTTFKACCKTPFSLS